MIGSVDNKRGLRVVLLGGFEVWVGERAVESSAWRLSKAKDVIKVLALSPGRKLQRDQVLEMLWPGRDPHSAVNNLHQVLHAARQAIDSVDGGGHACLRLEAETLALCPGGDLWVDADEFEMTARSTLKAGQSVEYESALELYSGELLPDDRYADWVQGRREILLRLKLDLMAGLAHHLESAGELAAAADTLRRLLVEDQTNEGAHRNLMRVYAIAGDRNAAARQYERLEQVLHDELGVDPEQVSQDMHDEIAAGDIGPRKAGTSLAVRSSTNLGAPLSSFIGREHELTELGGMMGDSRMITLVGAGGCGKTRLAVELGRRCLDDYTGGVFLVELAPVGRAKDVALELMRTLGVRRGPDETSVQAVGDRVGEDDTLLILDNCEHVIDGVAQLVGALLTDCPRLNVLATSREPIRVPGEVVRRVSSLRAPDPDLLPSVDELVQYDAVQLFAERAWAVQGDFEIDEHNAADVALVCFRLDGMPLALELAAARVPALSISGVARNLDDRFRLLTDGPRTALSRQRTLRATVDWSFDLLTAEEKALFLRLSIFNGAFDFDAAQALASAELQSQVAPLLGQLVERSMVVAHDIGEQSRYRLLETMREYGRARLRDEGRLSETGDDHAKWLLRLVETSVGRSMASDRPRLISRLAIVHDELRPAVDHLLTVSPRDTVRLVSLLWPYWLWHDHLGEGLAVIEHVLEHATGPSMERADMLIGAAALAFRWKGFAEMERYAALSLEEAEAHGDTAGVCRALIFSAVGPFDRDDYSSAHALFRRTLDIAQTEEAVDLEISARLCLAMVAAARRRFAEAGDLLDRAEMLASELDEDEGILNLYTLGTWIPTRRRGEQLHMWSETFLPFEEGMGQLARASILAARANLERLLGRFDQAALLLEEALELYEGAGDEAGQALALCSLGQLAFNIGDFEQADRLLKRSLHVRREIRHVRGVVTSLISLVRLATERDQIEQARRYLEEAEMLCRQRVDRLGTSLVLLERAQVDMADGDAKSAVAHLSEALPIARAFGGYGINIACFQRDLGEAKLAMGDPAAATTSLAEAVDIFERDGYTGEAERCQKMRATAGA